MEIIITTNRTEGLVAAHFRKIANVTGSTYMAVSKVMLIEAAKEQMRKGVCHFVYRKADGSIREAFGTLDKGVLARTLNGAGQSPETWGCCYYHDVLAGGARSFRWENLVAVLL